MGLSNDLISQFAKVVNNDGKTNKTEKTIYGTIEDNGSTVRLDGSDKDSMPAIPINNTTTNVKDGNRVTVLIKNHSAIVTGNLTDPAPRTGEVVTGENLEVVTAEIENLKANKANVSDLNAANAEINNLKTNKANVSDLTATNAKVTNLETNKANVSDLTATNAEITTLKSDKLSAKDAQATYATIANLNAAKADISDLDANLADIDTLIFGSATGNTIQTSFANAVIAQLGNAQIKSAMIDSIAANKITSGDIITNNVSVKSSDGKLNISDETIQISDDSRVRVQIGKDLSNDYSINVWDQNGNLMFSKGGITDSAIKTAIIRNDMVSDTANIAAHKLDIDSLFEEINDGSNTIKSTKVYLDDEKQTLDLAFKTLTTEVTEQGETITSQGTQISTIQGQITNKIWQQDINTAANTMSTKYSELNQKVDGISSTVSETYATKTDLSTTDSNVTTAKNTADDAVEKVVAAESLISQLSDSISMLVTDGNGTSLMTQTENGWVFSTAEIQTSVNSVSENLSALTQDVEDVDTAVGILQQAVTDLGEMAEYINITTFEDEPCIELGEGDSDFKLRITNTRMMFTEGSSVLAYFTNQSFNSKKVVIEEELQQGGFVWQIRENGNLGLTWKGGSN